MHTTAHTALLHTAFEKPRPLNDSEIRYLGLNESDSNIFIDLNSSQKYAHKLKEMDVEPQSSKCYTFHMHPYTVEVCAYVPQFVII